MREIRQAVRSLLASPGAALISIVALALGIGANVTVLISLNALLLHPFAYPDSDRLVFVSAHPDRSNAEEQVAAGDFQDLEDSHGIFESIAAFRATEFNVQTLGAPDHVRAAVVTPEFLHVLGLAPIAGDGSLSDKRSVVVSEAFWRSHLGTSPATVGSVVRVGGMNRVVTGIMPDSFDFPLDTQIWIPIDWTPQEQQDRSSHDLSVLARLRPGVTVQQAKLQLDKTARLAAEQYPQYNRNRGLTLKTLRGSLVDDVTTHFVLFLCAAAFFVLLLACTNVGNLQLARAAYMRKQIAVQIALGASRLQTLRPFLVQNMLLALTASVCSLGMASLTNGYLRSNLPAVALQHVPGLRNMQIDATVLALTFGLTVLAATFCVMPAAWLLQRTSGAAGINDWLHERSTTPMASPGGSFQRSALIIAQLSLAMVLLFAAGLMVETFDHLLSRSQGYDPNNLLTAQLSLGHENRTNATVPFYDELLRELSARPGIVATGLICRLHAPEYFQIEGRPKATAAEVQPELSSVNAQYVKAMRIPFIMGRNIVDGDRMESRHVAVISQSLARHYWKDQSPLGQRIRFADNNDWFTIVGVCGDIVEDWFTGTPQVSVYVPYPQRPATWGEVNIRTTGDPLREAAGVRDHVRRLNGDASLYDVKSMQARNFEERFGVYSAAQSMMQYAGIALLLALTGVYAVISFFVAVRTRDIGICIALGASSRSMLAMIMGQTVRLVSISLAIGVPASFLLARVMSHALFGVVGLDNSLIIEIAAFLATAAMLASLIPAFRATRIDPIVALREQ